MTEAEAVIARLGLLPHPEGGHYRETFRDAASTAIYYLLKAGERSHWHRIDGVEIWHFYAGAPLELGVSPDGKRVARQRLGPERPQIVVPSRHWQSAESRDAYSLVGCTVAPPFRFEGFELAPANWSPGGA